MQLVMDRLPITALEGAAKATTPSASSTGPPETTPITPSTAPVESPPVNAPPITRSSASASTGNDEPMKSSSASANDVSQDLQPKEHYFKTLLAEKPNITAETMAKRLPQEYSNTTIGEFKA